MIELKVEEYCQECKAFSPVSETIEYGDRYNFNTATLESGYVRTIVKCENAKRCAGIARHIRSEFIKESENRENESE